MPEELVADLERLEDVERALLECLVSTMGRGDLARLYGQEDNQELINTMLEYRFPTTDKLYRSVLDYRPYLVPVLADMIRWNLKIEYGV